MLETYDYLYEFFGFPEGNVFYFQFRGKTYKVREEYQTSSFVVSPLDDIDTCADCLFSLLVIEVNLDGTVDLRLVREDEQSAKELSFLALKLASFLRGKGIEVKIFNFSEKELEVDDKEKTKVIKIVL